MSKVWTPERRLEEISKILEGAAGRVRSRRIEGLKVRDVIEEEELRHIKRLTRLPKGGAS